MRHGEPIGLPEVKPSPEIAEIEAAIKEADDWIRANRDDIDDIKIRIGIEEDMINYAAEHNLTSPKRSITNLESSLAKAEQNLQRDLALREKLIKLKNDFHGLDWERVSQEVRMRDLLKKYNFPKPSD